jgi:hypothetical protein
MNESGVVGDDVLVDRDREKTLGGRSQIGCYVCGRTSASHFYWWRNSKYSSELAKIVAVRPESEEICAPCLRSMGTKPTRVHPLEVRSSLTVH